MDFVDAGVGTLLAGRYRLTARIGRGGMADVFRAEDEVLHRAVAVKHFRFDPATEGERARVDGEVRTLAALRHPGLVMVFDAGRLADEPGDATPFLVMELVDGPTLSQRLSDGPLPPHEAAQLGADLAATLAYVHDNGVVHRDVKPANILLDTAAAPRNGYAAKLTDFGIARIVDSAPLTLDGTTVGTANYLSPEQARGEPTSPASDVYSLGLVLIECLTGQIAFPGFGVEAALARLRSGPNVPARFGPAWRDLLTAMTADDPRRRPSTTEVAATLRELAVDPAGATMLLSGPVAPGSTAMLPVVASTPPRTRYAVFAGFTLVAMVVAAMLLTGQHGERPPMPPSPSYPAVPGTLGSDLHRLELAATTVELRPDVQALAAAAAGRHYATAQAALNALTADADAARAAGTISPSQLTQIRAAAARVQADLAAVTRRPTPTRTVTVTPAVQQPQAPPGRRGGEHGGKHGGGGGD